MKLPRNEMKLPRNEMIKENILYFLEKAPYPKENYLEEAKDYILMSKVELHLLMTISNYEQVARWLRLYPKDFFEKNDRSGYDFFPVLYSLTGHTINSSYPYESDDFVSMNNFDDSLSEGKYISEFTQQQIISQKKSNHLKNHKENFKLLMLYFWDNYWLTAHKPSEKIASYHLAEQLYIKRDDFTYSANQRNSFITPSLYKNFSYDSHGLQNNTEKFRIIEFQKDDFHSELNVFETDKLILPFSNWHQRNSPTPLSFYIFPAIEKLPLYNINKLNLFKKASVCLTSYLDLANNTNIKNHNSYEIKFNNKYTVWTSWYGGYDSIDRVDWTPLIGRSVNYILWNYIGIKDEALKVNIKIVQKLYKKFKNIPNMYFKVLFADIDKRSVRELHSDDLIRLFEFSSLSTPKDILANKDGWININIRQKHDDNFLVEPIIKTNTLSVLYASAGIGKTWLGLSIGLAVANGVDVIHDWKVKKAVNVLYILGEMEKNEIENRIYDLNKIYQNVGNSYTTNFDVIRDDFDLAQKEDQKKLKDMIHDRENYKRKKFSFVIVDNLTTLVKNGEKTKAWDSLSNFLRKDLGKNRTILLIHHANKEGKYLGTSKIKNFTDFMIKASRSDETETALLRTIKTADKNKTLLMKKIRNLLYPTLPNSKILIYVTHAKIRSLPEASFSPLRLTLELGDEPKWKSLELNYESILTEIGLTLEDLLNDFHGTLYNSEKQIPPEDMLAKYKIWKDVPKEEYTNVMQECVVQRGMKSNEIAERFKISKRHVDNLRKKTKTRKQDFKNT